MIPDHDYDRALDELIRQWRRSYIAANDASFDFEAGLADVRDRAGRVSSSGAADTGQARTNRHRRSDPPPDQRHAGGGSS
jgi:hypothetical protein